METAGRQIPSWFWMLVRNYYTSSISLSSSL